MKTNRTIRNCPKKFRFVCSKTWDDLQATDSQSIRHCEACNRDVHFCLTDKETIEHAKSGHCIARELPDESELPLIYLGQPANVPEPTEQQEVASAWLARENGIDDAIKNVDSVRSCPSCDFPAPPWRISCRVCGFEMKRRDQ